MIALPCYAGQLQRWTIRRTPYPTPQQGQMALKRCRHQQQRRVQSSSETFQQTISDDEEPDHDNYMQEYKQLKDKLLDNTRKSGSAIGLYFLLLVNGQAAACCMLGTAFSYGYMWLLCQDVDSVKGTDIVPYWEADKIENAWLRRGAKVAAAYQQALRPRLLVPVAMAALLGAINLVAEEPLPLVYQGCALGGFLSYKIALLLETFQQNSLKARSAGDDDRPVVERLDDELDMYGRPKKALTSPAAVLPEEQQLKVEQQLAEEEAKQQRKQAR